MQWSNEHKNVPLPRTNPLLTDAACSIRRRDANPYTYTGRRLDDETGLYQYRYRYYHAQLGRFATRDPILYWGSRWNLSAYVGNNPTIWVDPLGLFNPGSYGPFCHKQTQITPLFKAEQDRLDYLQSLLDELIVYGDKTRSDKNWTTLRSHLDYARKYDKIGPAGVRVLGRSVNFPVVPGFFFDPEAFWGTDYNAMINLIHEPMHDLQRGGFGHKHINPIIGPYSQKNLFEDYFETLLRGGVWPRMKKRARDKNGGTDGKPKKTFSNGLIIPDRPPTWQDIFGYLPLRFSS